MKRVRREKSLHTHSLFSPCFLCVSVPLWLESFSGGTMNRRDCLKLGLGALLGGGLASALRLRSLAAEGRTVTPAADSCILIWMDGGPTHYETFDPKPNAPAEIRGQFGTIPTRIAGARFSEHMQRLAAAG